MFRQVEGLMTRAYWMILVAALLPYLTVALAKAGGGYDNAEPRIWSDRMRGWRRRAHAAHQNHLEAFPAFAAAVIVAELANARQPVIDGLAVGFVVLRIGYTAAYVSGRPSLRSLIWGLGLLCVIALFCAGIGR